MKRRKDTGWGGRRPQPRVYSAEGTYTMRLGERPGRCDCKEPLRNPRATPKSCWWRSCWRCKRWVGPAYYPAWYGEHRKVVWPERVACNPYPKRKRKTQVKGQAA